MEEPMDSQDRQRSRMWIPGVNSIGFSTAFDQGKHGLSQAVACCIHSCRDSCMCSTFIMISKAFPKKSDGYSTGERERERFYKDASNMHQDAQPRIYVLSKNGRMPCALQKLHARKETVDRSRVYVAAPVPAKLNHMLRAALLRRAHRRCFTLVA